MKIKMLPNWGKKLGFLVFIISMIINSTFIESRKSFYEGYYVGLGGEKEILILKPILFERVLGSQSLHFFSILIIIGLIIYMFSREKVEDDYIDKLRLESFQLTSLIGLAVLIILYIVFKTLKLELDYFVLIFLIIYLNIFALKKRHF
jgi:hypothetical protein|tara:strand:- start:478 stop:921 length:444 start_codon:yes stop_codon:yes gene_type:complete